MLYKEYKEKWNKYKYIKLISPLKKSDEFSWLKEVNSQSLQQAIIDLDKGFKNFFQKRAKYPQFKSKHKSKKAFRVPQFVKVNFDAKRVFIPKFKEGIKCKLHRMFFGTIKNATVSMTKSGKYFISIIVDDEITVPALKREPVKHNSLGIDLGIKDFAILSDGTKISNPEIKQYNKKIERLHRKLSKKQKGSKNRQKAKIKLACLYEKVNNIKSDFLHKLSKKIINENQIDHIFIEDLNVSGKRKSSLAELSFICSSSSSSW
jgi:putative transposase